MKYRKGETIGSKELVPVKGPHLTLSGRTNENSENNENNGNNENNKNKDKIIEFQKTKK